MCYLAHTSTIHWIYIYGIYSFFFNSLYLVYLETFSALCSIIVIEPLVRGVLNAVHMLYNAAYTVFFIVYFSLLSIKNLMMKWCGVLVLYATERGLMYSENVLTMQSDLKLYSFCHNANSTTASTNDVAFS